MEGISDYYEYGDSCDQDDPETFMNLTVEEAQGLLLYSHWDRFYIQYILPFLLFVGVLDNTAFIYVVAKQSSMKTATNRYLVNLAIADIVFLLSVIGEKLWKYINSPFVDDDTSLGHVGCIIVPFIGDTAYFSSLIFVTLVSAEIFFAVCYPKGKSLLQHRTWSIGLTIMAWVASALTAGFLIPSNLKVNVLCFTWPEDEEICQKWPTELTTCGSTKKWFYTLAHVVQIVPFFITLILNSFLYVKIVVGLNRSIERLRSHTSVKREGDTHLRNQIARMLVVNGVVFFLLLAPFEILSLLQAFQASIHANVETIIAAISRALMYFNSVVNPIIYTAMSQRYREAFKSAFNPGPKCRILGSLPNRGAQPSSTQTYFKMSQTTTKI